VAGVETKEFSSMLEFLSWKEEEETNSYTCFVQLKGEVEKLEGTENSTGKNMMHDEVRQLY